MKSLGDLGMCYPGQGNKFTGVCLDPEISVGRERGNRCALVREQREIVAKL